MLILCTACRRQYDVSGLKAGEHVRCMCSQLIEVPRRQAIEARVQRCSACGGQLAEAAAQCTYCGSAVRRSDRGLGEVCPQCFARMGAQDRFCGACGLEILPQRISVVPYDAQCPRCRGELKTCSFKTGEAYVECAQCAGLWLEESHFEALVQRRDQTALGKQFWERARAQADDAARDFEALNSEHRVAYLQCPKCRQHMHRKNYGQSSGIIVDWCRGHGFWFDCTELERVLRFVDRGGLDRSRELNLEQQRLEAKRLQSQTDRHRRWHFEEEGPQNGLRFGWNRPMFLSDIGRWLLDSFGL